MDKEYIFIVYESDAHLAREYQFIRGIFDYEIDAIESIVANNEFRKADFFEDINDVTEEDVQKYIRNYLSEHEQITGSVTDIGYYIDAVEKNTWK